MAAVTWKEFGFGAWLGAPGTPADDTQRLADMERDVRELPAAIAAAPLDANDATVLRPARNPRPQAAMAH